MDGWVVSGKPVAWQSVETTGTAPSTFVLHSRKPRGAALGCSVFARASIQVSGFVGLGSML